jgi:hypothetical protein
MLDWLAEKVSDQQVMVERAQRLNPDITFHQGDMLSLANVANNSHGGAAAFYSFIHFLDRD